jgi:hypothetical protein
VNSAHMPDIDRSNEVVLCEATNSMYTWVAVNSASAGQVVASHQDNVPLRVEARDTPNRDRHTLCNHVFFYIDGRYLSAISRKHTVERR